MYEFENQSKKLFLLDAFALIYRAYYALIRAPRTTSQGINTSAIFGFVNTLDEVLRKENPTHIAVCFDPPGKTFRHEAYPEYKAQREKQPEDITVAIPYIKKILTARGIRVIEVEGYEADDVIGTLSRMAENEGFVTYMMTPDKDYGQLVTDRVFMYRPSLKGEGFEIRGPRQVEERYGVSNPRQVIDLLALEGDVSDNVPGCPGVGEKTARKLIAEYGSVEGVIENSESIKGALKTKITEHAEQILFSKFLVTINTQVPLDITPESLIRGSEDNDALRKIYQELEFRTLLQRLDRKDSSENGNTGQTAKPTADADGYAGSLFDNVSSNDAYADTECASCQWIELSEPDELRAFVDTIAEGHIIAIDIVASAVKDSTVADAMNATIEAMSVCRGAESGETVYFRLPTTSAERVPWLTHVRRMMSQSNLTVASHTSKRDLILLAREDIRWSARLEDTAVAHYLLEPEHRHSLESVAQGVCSMAVNDASQSPAASAQRACAVRSLVPRLRELLAESHQTNLLDEIELPMVRVLATMEMNGVRVDTAELHHLSTLYTTRLREMEEQLFAMAGTSFNVGSPMQVGEVLFERMKIDPKAKRTKRGAYSTTEDILEKYRHQWPAVDLILKIRALRKLLTTYIDALPTMVNPRTGRIHTTFQQTVTATGRISSTNPNLQNIPIRTDDGREIRRAFVADPGCQIMSADYSQIELRLLANLSKDPDLTEAFLSGQDIHTLTAARIYHVPVAEVTPSQRRNAKTANFGTIYGISAFGLSERLGIPRAEARELIEGYFNTYPHIRQHIEQAVQRARENGYVQTIMGRRRYLPEINSRNATVRSFAERNAVNAPLQGSAADIIKLAMIRIDRCMRHGRMRSTMIMQVHDELVFNVAPGELSALQQLVVREMERAYIDIVPLQVSVGVGLNWLEAH